MGNSEKLTNGNGLYLEKVPPTMLSSDILSPLQGPRPTQSSIGLFLKKEQSLKEESMGTHYTCYGGIGDAKIPGESPRRDHNHYRTGIDSEIPSSNTERWNSILVERNKALFGQPVQRHAMDINHAMKNYAFRETPVKKVKKSLFPRSIVYEIEYMKEQAHKSLLAALEKQRAEFEAKMYKGKSKKEKEKLNEESASPDFNQTNEDVKDEDARDANETTEKRKATDVCTSKDVNWPKGEINLLDPYKDREEEFLQVGKPFRTEAVKWAQCNIVTENPGFFKSKGKKCFPDWGLSSINI